MPSLTVAIATTDQRIAAIKVDQLPAGDGWRYLIACQGEMLPPQDLELWIAGVHAQRPDIEVVRIAGTGVTANRNAALSMCRTELLLFSDDDVAIVESGLRELIRVFQRLPVVDIVCGRTEFSNGGTPKTYPPGPCALSLFNSAHVGTVELAVRPATFTARNIRFDAAFGAGAKYPLGDEYILISDALRAGVKGVHRPILLALHHGESSGTIFDTHSARARAAVFERVFGPLAAPLVKLVFLWRHRRRFASPAALGRFGRVFLQKQYGSSSDV